MHFAFENEAIREICEKSEKAIETYGQALARALQSRLADLEASERISELPTGNPEIVSFKPLSRCRIHLIENWYLLIIADHIRKYPTKNEDVDWPNVTYVQIFEIISENEKAY